MYIFIDITLARKTEDNQLLSVSTGSGVLPSTVSLNIINYIITTQKLKYLLAGPGQKGVSLWCLI